ncbi:DUF2750 domain-containing protein [Mammaliicoccus lentus]|uniref:DUF2750 domain-containing protein n=1 Tax=Mammaliicoccus TaxID=2803850 RepID=UPI001C4F5B1B|nr:MULTISPECIES: DUF2750 domain-containing protein [Mammaliicoccus]MBW0762124.1 DUF2750 domain-containing protein [Mammaliicoccus lentus]
MAIQDMSMFKQILTKEKFYVVLTDKRILRDADTNTRLIWSKQEYAEKYLKETNITTYEKVMELDLDRFVTYEMDDILDEGDRFIVDRYEEFSGTEVEAIRFIEQIMSELDDIRIEEFAEDICNEDYVYGLTVKGQKQFIIVSEEDSSLPNMMTVWSTRKLVEKVHHNDFEEYDIIEVETEVFEEWLEDLKQDNIALGVNLKPGMIGTVTDPKVVLNAMPC